MVVGFLYFIVSVLLVVSAWFLDRQSTTRRIRSKNLHLCIRLLRQLQVEPGSIPPRWLNRNDSQTGQDGQNVWDNHISFVVLRHSRSYVHRSPAALVGSYFTCRRGRYAVVCDQVFNGLAERLFGNKRNLCGLYENFVFADLRDGEGLPSFFIWRLECCRRLFQLAPNRIDNELGKCLFHKILMDHFIFSIPWWDRPLSPKLARSQQEAQTRQRQQATQAISIG